MVKPTNNHENRWKLWYELRTDADPGKSGYYGDRLKEVCSMDSVESFNQYYVYMKSPDEMPLNSNIYIFHDDIKPMWESLPEGGAWTFRLKRDDARLHHAWENLVLSCTGEGLGSSNVAGVVLGSRPREFVLSVWLESGQTSELRFEILQHLKEILKLQEGDTLQFKDFTSSLKDDSGRHNAVSYRIKSNQTFPKVEDHKNRKYLLPDPVTGVFTFNY
jgi:hypothetical protein